MFPSFQFGRRALAVDADAALHDNRVDRRALLTASSPGERDPALPAHPQRAFTSDHRRTLQSAAELLRHMPYPLIHEHVRAASSLTHRLIERDSLSFLGDMLDIHVPARSPQDLGPALCLREESRRTVGYVLEAISVLLRRSQIAPQTVARALTAAGMEDRPPFLLALATAAMHDPELADAMCDLLTILAEKLGPAAVSQMLLTTDSALGCRPREQLPKNLSEKYTDFLGRLIGDGYGEWGNDGAVRAIKRLNDAGLLPDKEAVRRCHSTQRWRKQAQFVRICEDLAPRPPWNASKPIQCPHERRAAMARVLSRADDIAARASAQAPDVAMGAGAGSVAAWESRIWRALDETWQTARQWYRAILLHEVQLPNVGLPGSGGGGMVQDRCVPGLLRLGQTPSPQALDAVMRQVVEDPEVRDGLARGADLDDPHLSAAVEVSAQEAARRLLDPTERLEGFLTAWQLAACDLRHAPGADGNSRELTGAHGSWREPLSARMRPRASSPATGRGPAGPPARPSRPAPRR
ncbi:hypothetical protein ACNI65_07015 [Roseateles sp. So40a]|uniref:hypothetical protein n=1 Tax=Roseateles sp. So40a TaxID=3400226 RepID=UPI003A8BF43A